MNITEVILEVFKPIYPYLINTKQTVCTQAPIFLAF